MNDDLKQRIKDLKEIQLQIKAINTSQSGMDKRYKEEIKFMPKMIGSMFELVCTWEIWL